MFKKNNVITVANLQAFGVVCYSQATKQILLIPKRKDATENEGISVNIHEMVDTYVKTSGIGDVKQFVGTVFYFLILFSAIVLISFNSVTYPKTFSSYFIFFLLSMTSGLGLGNLVFSNVHKSLKDLDYKAVYYIDDEIGAILKKKLKRDLLISTFLPLIIIASFICVPFTLEQYLSYLPVSISSFLLIGLASFVVYGIYTISPPFLKWQAYKKVKQLIVTNENTPE